MKLPLAPSLALVLGLGACAPAIRPLSMTGPNGGNAAYGAMNDEDGNAWADAALDAPGRVAPLTAADVRGTVDVSALAAGSWDIAVLPYVANDRVAHYVDLFTGPARERVLERLRRGTRYEAMIRAKLRAGGLPEDLYYLAFVESGFEQHAYSRAAAVGMWQFMTTTARGVGLRVDWWVDERRDPVRATDGAVRFLRGLRNQFDGSVYLAAAAYNGGPGRVSRGLAQHADEVRGAQGEDRFFALVSTGYLRDETSEYVPQLIAAALIAKAPAAYGMTVAEPLPPFVFDTVRVPGGTALAAVAEASDATLAEILDLNAHYLRGATPPGKEAIVRVPVGRGEGFADRFAALPADRRAAFTTVTTEDNGRLSAIAARHGYEEAQLALYNPGIRRNGRGLLVGGQTVLVPAKGVLEAALDVADPAVELYGTSPDTPLARAAAAAAKAPSDRSVEGTTKAASSAKAPAPSRTHRVVAGDALESLARRYDVSVAELRRLNGLTSDVIRIGQRLTVRAGERSAAK